MSTSNILIVLILLTLSFSQESVTVYFKYSNEKSIAFEKQFMEEIKKLHNARHKKSPITLKFTELSGYKELFSKIDKPSSPNLVCAISSITITKNRLLKYDFSYRYLKINQAIIKNTKSKLKDFNNAKFAYLENSIHQEAFNLLKKQYPKIRGISYKTSKEIKNELDNKKFNYQIADGIVAFINENREIVTELSFFKTDGYGIIYPKNSQLKKRLESAIRYFVSTSKYFQLIKKHFGNNAFKYYKSL